MNTLPTAAAEKSVEEPLQHLPELPKELQRIIYRQKIKADDMETRKKTWRRTCREHWFATTIRGIQLKHFATRALIERRLMLDAEDKDWNYFVKSRRRGVFKYRMNNRWMTHFLA